MGKAKKVFKVLLIILIVIIVIITSVIIGLSINYLVTKEEPESYLSEDFLIYTRVDSLWQVYNDLLHLEAVESLFSALDAPEIFLALNEIKSKAPDKNILLPWLLKIDAHIMLNKEMIPLVVLDPGYKSSFTRLFPTVYSFYKPKGLDMITIQKGDRIYFQYEINEEFSLYFTFQKNLILLSTDLETIITAFKINSEQTGILAGSETEKQLFEIKGKLREQGALVLYADMDQLLPLIMGEESKEYQFLQSEIDFQGIAALTLKASPDQLSLSLCTDMKPKADEVSHFFRISHPGSMKILSYIPDDSTLFSALKFSSFSELYKTFLYLQKGEYDKTLAKADKAAKALLGISIDEALAWTGSEGGAFFLEAFTDPVIYIEAADQTAWEDFLKKLTDSLFLKEENNIVINNVRIRQIGFPPFIQSILDLFIEGLREPYFIQIDQFLFFSMDPEALSSLYLTHAKNRTIMKSNLYSKLTKDFPEESNAAFYFDLSESRPAFLLHQPALMAVMNYYARGILTLSFSEKDISVELISVPLTEKKTRLYPGYPVPLAGEITGDFRPVLKKEGSLPLLAYVDSTERLRLINMKGETVKSAFVAGTGPVLLDREETVNKDLFILTNEGNLYLFDNNLTVPFPYPLTLWEGWTFNPFEKENDLYYYSLSERSVIRLEKKTGNKENLPFNLIKPLMAPPAFKDDLIALYPKDLTGTVYLIDKNGTGQEGWPVKGGSASYSSPRFIDVDSKTEILFLTQSGNLNLWDIAGKEIKGFPVDIDSVFYTAPVIIGEERKPPYTIGLLDAEGYFHTVSTAGKYLGSTKIPGIRGKGAEVELLRIGDKKEEYLVFHGNRDFLLITKTDLTPLPGFPVKGFTDPVFFDINGDSRPEMITAGLDDKLYLYSLETEK